MNYTYWSRFSIVQSNRETYNKLKNCCDENPQECLPFTFVPS